MENSCNPQWIHDQQEAVKVTLSDPLQVDGLVVAATFNHLAVCNRKAKHIREGTSWSEETTLWHSKKYVFDLGDAFISNH